MAFHSSDLELDIPALAREFESYSSKEILQWCWDRFGTKASIGTSFQGSGLVSIHLSRQLGLDFPIFTIDTGFLFAETLALKAKLEAQFDLEIEAVQPEQTPAEQEAEHGPELWKRAPDLCCTMRKVLPLQRKLNTVDVWITGLRRQQSDTRQETRHIELYKFDVLRDLYIIKLNPMASWSREEIWEYLHQHKIPYNPLLDRGYRSIGCTHCTRPVQEGENERAGRWTGFDKSECGIHTFLGANI